VDIVYHREKFENVNTKLILEAVQNSVQKVCDCTQSYGVCFLYGI